MFILSIDKTWILVRGNWQQDNMHTNVIKYFISMMSGQLLNFNRHQFSWTKHCLRAAHFLLDINILKLFFFLHLSIWSHLIINSFNCWSKTLILALKLFQMQVTNHLSFACFVWNKQLSYNKSYSSNAII